MKKEEWKKHIEAQEKSGKSISEYCREHGLSLSAFGYQRSTQRERFVQVGGKELIEIVLPEGVTIRVSESQISHVLKMVRDDARA